MHSFYFTLACSQVTMGQFQVKDRGTQRRVVLTTESKSPQESLERRFSPKLCAVMTLICKQKETCLKSQTIAR